MIFLLLTLGGRGGGGNFIFLLIVIFDLTKTKNGTKKAFNTALTLLL